MDDAKYLALAQETQFSMVGQVLVKDSDGGTKLGTGTFIGIGKKSAWIVTAAHEVTDLQDGSTFKINGNSYALGANPTFMKDRDIAVVPILGYKEGDLTAATFSDIAVTVPPDERKRTMGYLVGYGLSGTGSAPGTVNDNQKRACTNNIDAYNMKRQKGFQRGQPDYQIYLGYLSDFDSGKAAMNTLDHNDNTMYGLLGNQRSAANATALEGGADSGDSGGPLFVQNGSAWILAGVISGTFKSSESAKNGLGYGGWTNCEAIDPEGAKFITGATGIAAVKVVSP